MQTQTYVVTNERGQFYTEAGHGTWSTNLAIAHKYQDPDEARAIAHLENACVVPHSD